MPKGGKKMKRILAAFSVPLLLAAFSAIGSGAQAAENYPQKPITCIIPQEAGSDGDINNRKLMEKASAILGKPIVLVNKPGAGQIIGNRELYRAKPDGYTIGTGSAAIIVAKLQGLFPYNYRDFTLISFTYHALPIVLASTKSKHPFKSLEEVVSFAKANPGEVSVATTAVGGPYWLAALIVQEGLKVKFNIIPQEGSGGMVISQVAGGHTDLGISSFAAAKSQIEAGNIRFLAVAGPQRYPGKYNQVKTLKEMGYEDASMSSFVSVMGPPKMPKDIVDKLVKTFEQANADPGVKNFILARNMIPDFMPPDKFFQFCEQQEKVYRAVLQKVGKLKEK